VPPNYAPIEISFHITTTAVTHQHLTTTIPPVSAFLALAIVARLVATYVTRYPTSPLHAA